MLVLLLLLLSLLLGRGGGRHHRRRCRLLLEVGEGPGRLEEPRVHHVTEGAHVRGAVHERSEAAATGRRGGVVGRGDLQQDLVQGGTSRSGAATGGAKGIPNAGDARTCSGRCRGSRRSVTPVGGSLQPRGGHPGGAVRRGKGGPTGGAASGHGAADHRSAVEPG